VFTVAEVINGFEHGSLAEAEDQVVQYNDFAGRTWQEIDEVFRKAEALALSRGL
jgi:hypothetical protein